MRVIVADDHQPMREYLASLLERQPGVEVVGHCPASDCRLPLRCDADVVLLDVALPLSRVLATTHRLRAVCPRVQVLAVSMHNEMAFAATMLAAGAAGYVLKDDPLDEILAAIHDVAAHRRHLSARLGSD